MAGMDMTSMTMSHSSGTASSKAVQLRITLNELLGEHAILAVQATQRGLVGGKDFPALAKALDNNSVAISKAIGSVYGAAAGKQFLNGKNLWRVAYRRLRRLHGRDREARSRRPRRRRSPT